MAIVLINEIPTEVGSGADEIIRLREELAAAQAKIDSLMFEYCPDEMTPEQISEWGKWQRPIDSDKQAAIDDAIAEN